MGVWMGGTGGIGTERKGTGGVRWGRVRPSRPPPKQQQVHSAPLGSEGRKVACMRRPATKLLVRPSALTLSLPSTSATRTQSTAVYPVAESC